MGRRGRRRVSFWRKNFLWFICGGILILLISALVFGILSFSNPYRKILRRAGVEMEQCKWKKGVLTLTFQGDAVGILSCRDALNALRSEKTPDQVDWILVKGEEKILSGTVEEPGFLPEPSSPRVETLSEDLTLVKLKYELTQNGITAQVQSEPTVGLNGKTVTVTVSADLDSFKQIAPSLPSAVETVNAQGGGIVRCDVIFAEEGGVFAAASYDFAYGDTLLSSAFYQE